MIATFGQEARNVVCKSHFWDDEGEKYQKKSGTIWNFRMLFSCQGIVDFIKVKNTFLCCWIFGTTSS
jgi:hypothetical protein